MKNIFKGKLAISALLLLMAFAVSTSYAQSRGAAKQRGGCSLVVLYENDAHCAIDGYAKLAGLRDAISDTADVLLVSSGDFLQGNTAGAISKGQYIIDVMKTVGYDVITLGNHEFDYKVPRMLELTSQLDCQTVCANLFDAKSGKSIFAPYTIKKLGKWKIAFVGAVTPSTMQSERYAFYSDEGELLYTLKPEKVYSLVQQAADQARKEGADFVFVLSHLGEDKTDENVDSHGLAAATRGIDIILDGHTHSLRPADTVLNLDGRPVPITQTGAELANIGKLVVDAKGRTSLSMIPTTQLVKQNPKVIDAVAKVKKDMQKVTSQVVCHSDYVLQILDDAGEYLVRYAETNAGDLVTDAYRWATHADIALSNAGGLRNQIEAGDITYGDLIRLLPYDNYLTVVEVKGSTLAELLRRNTAKMSYDNGDFPQCAGLRYTIHTDMHTVTDIEVLNPNGIYVPIDPERTYTLATIDYCVSGGGFGGVLADCKVLKKTSVHYLDAVRDYIANELKGQIGIRYAKPQGRIRVVGQF